MFLLLGYCVTAPPVGEGSALCALQCLDSCLIFCCGAATPAAHWLLHYTNLYPLVIAQSVADVLQKATFFLA